MTESEFAAELESRMIDTTNRKLQARRDFLIIQIDSYLLAKFREWVDALAKCDLGRMTEIRNEAHALVDSAFDYNLPKL